MAQGEIIEMRTMDEEAPKAAEPRKSLWKRWKGQVKDFILSVDERVNRSTFGRVFRLKGCGHPEEIEDASFITEIRAGLTTFATMSYIIAVNASILGDTGGTCVCQMPLDPSTGNCGNNDDYVLCTNEVRRDLITATAALSAFSSFLFGFLTNLPVALAPGMGLNAYFTYQVVGVKGSGTVPYRLALTAVFVEGWIFMFLALTGMRHWLVKIIPGTIKTASGVGIGCYLTLLGLSYSSGIGLVTGAVSTPLTIAGCDPSDVDSVTGECTGNLMSSPKMWIGICASGLLTAMLMSFRVKSAIVIGIALVSILSWPRDTPFTYFPYTAEGEDRFDFFKQVVTFHPITTILAVQQWDLSGGYGAHFALALFTFLYVDIVDCTATLYSMARFCNKTRKGEGDFPRSTMAYCTDAFCISIGALLGCSPVTAFVESGAGIAEGGRTGLTAMMTGLCFLVSIFFAPIFASIPPWATGCTLILVGCLMVRQVVKINWRYIGDAVPSFVTMTLIPFTYSVAYGLIGGLFTYAGLNVATWVIIKCTGKLPKDYELKEYWTWKPAGEKPWLIRMFSKGRVWEDARRRNRHADFQLNDGDCASSMHHGSQIDSSVEDKYPHRMASPQPFRTLP